MKKKISIEDRPPCGRLPFALLAALAASVTIAATVSVFSLVMWAIAS